MPLVRDSNLEETSYNEQEDYDESTINQLNPNNQNEQNSDDSDSSPDMETSQEKVRRKSKRLKASKNKSSTALYSQSTRRSSTTSHTSKKSGKKPNKKQSLSSNKELQTQLKTIISKCFGYEIREFDIDFIREIFTQLPKLNEIWSRIGFTTETKESRLEKFYNEVFVSQTETEFYNS
jgi:hypothetical protein